MNTAFEGSTQQRRILKLREVEGPLVRLRIVAELMGRTVDPDYIDAVDLIIEEAREALARLNEVER